MDENFDRIPGSRIFIIEEEVDLCLLMKTYYLRKGCQVAIAHDCLQAHTLINEFRPDIIYLSELAGAHLYGSFEKIREMNPGVTILVQTRNGVVSY